MNGAYIHLLINHIPVILAPLGAAVAILALFTRRRSVWLYAVATLTLSGLSAYPTMLTGHAAEHLVRHELPNVSKEAIDAHEEAADTATYILLVAGVISAYAWWRLARANTVALPTWLNVLVVIAGIVAAGAVSYASDKGGYIIHTEAHTSAPAIIAKPG